MARTPWYAAGLTLHWATDPADNLGAHWARTVDHGRIYLDTTGQTTKPLGRVHASQGARLGWSDWVPPAGFEPALPPPERKLPRRSDLRLYTRERWPSAHIGRAGSMQAAVTAQL